MVKIAMIGAGGYAYELLRRIWKLPESLELVAVSSNPLRKSAGRSVCIDRGVDVVPSVDELLDHAAGKADVILVPTPINTHFKLTKKCLDAGFEVWLEKPPVATIQELDYLQEYAQSKGREVAVMFQHLHSDLVQHLKADIVAGRFGSVKRVKGMAGWQRLDEYYSRSSWAGKLRINGDWILDGTVNNPLAHLLANQLYFASMEAGKLAEPISVQAELYHGHAIESEDTSSLRIQTSEQVEVLFNASLCSELQTGPITTVECENAVVEYINFNEATITYSDGKTQRLVNENEQRIHMLEKLAQCYNERKPYLVTLGMCRPFTVSVNGAFESCGTVHNVDDKFLLRSEYGDSIKTVIKGIDHLLRIAHDNGKLFSEISTSWSQSSKPVDVQEYAKFPSSGFNC